MSYAQPEVLVETDWISQNPPNENRKMWTHVGNINKKHILYSIRILKFKKPCIYVLLKNISVIKILKL